VWERCDRVGSLASPNLDGGQPVRRPVPDELGRRTSHSRTVLSTDEERKRWLESGTCASDVTTPCRERQRECNAADCPVTDEGLDLSVPHHAREGNTHLVLLPRAHGGEVAPGAAGDVKEVDAVDLALERRLGRQELARAAERLGRQRPGKRAGGDDGVSQRHRGLVASRRAQRTRMHDTILASRPHDAFTGSVRSALGPAAVMLPEALRSYIRIVGGSTSGLDDCKDPINTRGHALDVGGEMLQGEASRRLPWLCSYPRRHEERVVRRLDVARNANQPVGDVRAPAFLCAWAASVAKLR